MPLDLPIIQTSAAFTLAIFEPADQATLAILIGAGSRPLPPPSVHNSGTTMLDEVSVDPLRKYLLEAAAQRRLQRKIQVQIEDRLRELHVDAQIADEAFSEASVGDLREFIQSTGVTKRPAIFLLDNGNIRALWRDASGQQVGLQFLGGRRVQFVIFSRRESPRMMMRVAGIDSIVETRLRVVHDRVDHLLRG